MTVVVSFITAHTKGAASAVNTSRICEHLTVGSTTTNYAEPEEMVVVGNTETSMITVAFGKTPDAAATASSPGVTSAGIPVPSGGVSYPIKTKAGDYVSVKVVT
jgi:hypothetical protein